MTAEAAARARAAAEAVARLAAELKRKAAAEAARLKAAAEERQRKAEAEKKWKAEEAAKRKAAEEAAKKKAAEEEAAKKKAADEAAKKKAADEAAKKKAADDAKKKAQGTGKTGLKSSIAKDFLTGVGVAGMNAPTFGFAEQIMPSPSRNNEVAYQLGKLIGDLGMVIVSGQATSGLAQGAAVTAPSGAGALVLGAATLFSGAVTITTGIRAISDAIVLAKTINDTSGWSNPVKENMQTKIPNSDVNPPTKRGNAPTSKQNGNSVEIHHEGQDPNGPFHEMSRTDHRGGDNYKKNHPNYDQPSQIDRNEFNKQKKDYWEGEWDSGRWGD